MPKGKFEYFPTAHKQADKLPDEKLLELKSSTQDGYKIAKATNLETR